MTYSFIDVDIPTNRKMSVTVEAVCDGPCLRRVSKEGGGGGLCASTAVDCKPIVFMYNSVIFTTEYSPRPLAPAPSSWIGVMMVIVFMIVALFVLVYVKTRSTSSPNEEPSTPYR